MMILKAASVSHRRGLVVALVAFALSAATGQVPQSNRKAAAAPGPPSSTAAPFRYRPDRFAGRAGTYYRMVWGVEGLTVRSAESGEMIRFSYSVVDAAKAKALNDKNFEPALIDPQAGVKLSIPSLEKVGQLRQSGTPEAGKSYWMAFSNKGRLVKRGDRVSVIIGQFRADGLVVD